MTPEEIDRMALAIAHHGRGHDHRWADNCPEWVRERYRGAARLAWQYVLTPRPAPGEHGGPE